MKKKIFFVFIFFNLINFYDAQNRRSYIAFLDSANTIKYKDGEKVDLYIQKAKKAASDKDLGDFYLKAIQIYIDTNHFDEALEYCTKAHHLFTEKNDLEKLAKVNSFFAFIYAQLNDPQRAINYYKITLGFYEKKNDKAGMIKGLNNLGNAYLVLSKYDSSQYYFQRSHAIFKDYDDPVLKAFVVSNLGKLFVRKKEFTQAENYLLEAKNILEQNKIKDNETNYSVNYNLANFYIEQNKPSEALFYAKKTGDFFNKNSVSFNNIRYFKNLYKASELNSDYKNAVIAFTKYDSIRELMNIEEKAVNVERIKAQHEYELKQKLATLKQEKRNLIYIIVLVVFLLVVVICIFYTINYRNKTEALDLEKKLIEAREKELEFDNHMKEKLLVHQSMEQQKIDSIIKATLEKVNTLKTKYEDTGDITEIVNELKVNSKPNTWDDFEYHFLQIHESFYKNLEQKHPGLTNYDKRLAAMLKLRLSTKEISNLMNVTPKTIENSRTRLRKKMNLTNTKEDLSKYLDYF
ncbi:tetratricopeptide repeat protein [Chryseobacterium sp. Ch-15]|uniref:Tetratricopeptide repeat protein n=1 Tax=Chryseobacterium muglaense TaxID=2893752 RepID=A0A9Q3YWK2_9FLAO|nr:tetratricopeptide repeat protein [Chryseobacterium muglaense]MBD3905815.1 tetratricopeptide repeat protein [Chryseobacterium muglaense]MCC9035800.1 tetratricopeptide repeat protein [Chryseobacterium muglaense]MCM2555510.1 tetratricopeptide repeat protein [Chryseobacterium muglaense]